MVSLLKTRTITGLVLLALTLGLPQVSHAINWPSSPSLEAKSWALIDARSGQVLINHNADEELPPASLTKMMTLYLIFEDLKMGRIHADAEVSVSEKAWKIGGSTMFLDPRMKPTVGDLIHGIATYSGNDACIVMAEYIAGSEDAFADRMNEKAKQLGMKHTHFINATGFPAEGHYSSALDMAILGAALWHDFPEQYAVFSEKNFTYKGRTQWNRNRLLWSMPDADGIKTGHTEKAGFCLVGSVEKNNMRLVSAVFGTNSDRARMSESKALLSFGFRNFVSMRPAERDIRRQVRVYEGTENHVWLKPADTTWISVPRGYEDQLVFRLRYDSPLKAPVAENQAIGTIDAVIKDKQGQVSEPLISIPMQAAREIPQASWFGRQLDRLRLWWSDESEATADSNE